MNIIISCSGTRNKIVQYFKQNMPENGLVIATDSSPLASALYEADLCFTVPQIEDKEYLPAMLSLCRIHKVDAIIPLLDPELIFLAKHRQAFLDIGTVPILSNREAIETSFDKYKMNFFLAERGFPSLKTYLSIVEFQEDKNKGLIDFPVFTKPRQGSGSQNARVVYTFEDLRLLCHEQCDLMIQEFVSGSEYGADVYIDVLSRRPIALFLREKIRKRAGVTDRAVSIWDDELSGLLKELISNMDLVGPLDFDIIKANGNYYIVDVNPRFGGEYPTAYNHKINFPKMIIENLNGRENEIMERSYEPGIYSMKYYETLMIKNTAESWNERG